VNIAFFDPFSGAAGDMILAALIDAGLDPHQLRTGLASLGLEGYDLRVERVSQHGIAGTAVNVDVAEGQPQRDWSAIQPLIANSALPPEVRERALAIFTTLAEAEAQVHDVPVDSVHFHEVGAVDAIVDICGAAIGLALLGVDRVYSLPPVTGDGWVRAQHGLMPLPAPATARILADHGVPVGRPLPKGQTVGAELLTPTGAAILATLARFETPQFIPTATGYGFGTMQLPWPNALRVWLGTEQNASAESSSPEWETEPGRR
jgi:uncharacterized protein (TIGR00299 family) protein